MLDREQPKWVTKRANCRIEVIFEALSQVVERDVAEFNELPCEQRDNRTAFVSQYRAGTAPTLRVSVIDQDENEKTLTFSQHSALIKVRSRTTLDFDFRLVWDRHNRSYRLAMIGSDDRYEVWELSQFALSIVLFPH